MSRRIVLLMSVLALSVWQSPLSTSAQSFPNVGPPVNGWTRLPVVSDAGDSTDEGNRSATDALGADGEGPQILRFPVIQPKVQFPQFDEVEPGPSDGPPFSPVQEPAETMPFPLPPPPPDNDVEEVLPPVEEELWLHGGSYLYHPEGDHLGWPDKHDPDQHFQFLRLPETWQAPQPLTGRTRFLGADPIPPWPMLNWFGADGFQWEPRFVGYGGYQVFGLAFEDGNVRTDGIGHQLFVDLDLRITGTERAHVQFRPLGEKNTGGSLFLFGDPSGYIDNSTVAPQRWWIEGELFSIFGGLFADPFPARDYHFVVGKFPFALQNSLLINDEITGIAINKNTILVGPLSNVNVQVFYAPDDVDAFAGSSADLLGASVTTDFRRAFIETNYAYVANKHDHSRDANYAAIAGTQFFGPFSLAARALFKWGDSGGRGGGQLYVLESNYTRHFDTVIHQLTGVEYGVFYANAFNATSGWNSISGGNVNRLRATFAINPFVQLALARPPDNTYGAAFGVQLFRHHEDEAIIPEIAVEAPNEEPTGGIGLTYFRKLNARMFFEAQGVRTWSEDSRLEREGVILCTTVLF